MSAQLVLVPRISIHPDRICFYNEVNWLGTRKLSVDQTTGEELKKIKYDHLLKSARSANGKVSTIAQRKMKKAMEYLLLIANEKRAQSRHTGRHVAFKIAFITLTLPSKQIHSDNDLKSKLLNQFLIEVKKRHKVKNYIWRAEKQKNGNLHFHVLVDKFVPWSELRDLWNRICNKLGYVDRYRAEMQKHHSEGFKLRQDLLNQWSEKDQYKAYLAGKKTDWNSPNSTDVHSIRKVINIKAYMVKYLTKDEAVDPDTGEISNDNLKTNGRIWGCSRPLSDPKGAQLILDSYNEEQLKKAIEATKCKSYQGDYFAVFFIDFQVLGQVGAQDLFESFCNYLLDHFGYSYQLATG